LATGQLEGRAGSQLLKRETFAFGVVERFNPRAASRLRSVLQSDNMGITILILLAQIRGKIVFGSSGKRPKPVKLIGNLYDTCQVVMEMLLEFLTDNTEESQNAEDEGRSPVQVYAENLPSLGELLEKFGLNGESAWILCRPICRAALGEENDASTNRNGNGDAIEAYLPSSTGMRNVYPTMLPEAAWSNLSTDVFELFFSLSLYDISNPGGTYEAEISRLKKEEDRLSQLQKGAPGASKWDSALAWQRRLSLSACVVTLQS
jgi:THO complex subunit 2